MGAARDAGAAAGALPLTSCRTRPRRLAEPPGDQPPAVLQRYAERLPPEAVQSPSSLGAFLYSCTAVAHDEAGILASALPQLSFQVRHCTNPAPSFEELSESC